MVAWLRGEALALAALAGAALTVLGQLANAGALSADLAARIAWWPPLLEWVIRPPFEWIGLDPHPHVIAAAALIVFLLGIAAGGRVDARLSGAPLPPLRQFRCLDDMTWPSLMVFAALEMIFLIGMDSAPNGSPPLTAWGSETAGKYAFVLAITAGYMAGDWIGHRPFHERLKRLAGLVGVVWATDALMAVVLVR